MLIEWLSPQSSRATALFGNTTAVCGSPGFANLTCSTPERNLWVT